MKTMIRSLALGITMLATTVHAQPADKGGKAKPAKAEGAAPAAKPAKAEGAAPAAKPAKAEGAAPAGAPQAPPPEVAKLVQSFLGAHPLEASITLPDGKSDNFKFNMTCKKIAGGKGVACDMKAKTKVMGLFEGSALIAYDVGRKAIHFMSVTSDGDVHDHACQWKSEESITCERLKQPAADGSPVTEDISFTLAGGKLAGFSVKAQMGGGAFSFIGTKKKTGK